MINDTNRITTPFGVESTAAKVLEGIDLSDKRTIGTGASSGIGIETARALAGAGAEVTLAVRDSALGHAAVAQPYEFHHSSSSYWVCWKTLTSAILPSRSRNMSRSPTPGSSR
jgi:hypothetical protein